VKGENVEKWLLARFVDSAALEKLAETDINIFSYDGEKMTVIKNGVLYEGKEV
ncbi:MAG: hypothetical protein GXO29_00440, partial [Thermotogae bacterium]|nr:hypothetical protein [Thermotogota bacterium]